MKRRSLCPAVVLLAALACVPAHADPTTLDMNGRAWNLSGGYQSQGFVTSSHGGFAFIGNAGSCWPECAHNGSNYIWSGFSTIKVRSAGGQAFDLTQFDGAETHKGAPLLWAGAIEVVGQYAVGGSVRTQFTLDGVNDGRGPLSDFETFVLPTTFTGLSSVSFRVADNRFGQFALDNLVLKDSFQTLSVQSAALTVPEPRSLWLCGAALLLAATARQLAARRTLQRASTQGQRI